VDARAPSGIDMTVTGIERHPEPTQEYPIGKEGNTASTSCIDHRHSAPQQPAGRRFSASATG
jgi:hypothetical protein